MTSSPSRVSEHASYESSETGRERGETARSDSAAHWDAIITLPGNHHLESHSYDIVEPSLYPENTSTAGSHESAATKGARSDSSITHWDADIINSWNNPFGNNIYQDISPQFYSRESLLQLENTSTAGSHESAATKGAVSDSSAIHWGADMTFPWNLYQNEFPHLDNRESLLQSENASTAGTYSLPTELNQRRSDDYYIAPPASDYYGLTATKSSEPYSPAFLQSPIHEDTSADGWADEDLGNYSHGNRRLVSSKKPSTLIEEPSETPHSFQRELYDDYEPPTRARNSAREKKRKLLAANRPLNTAPREGQRQGSSEVSTNAGDLRFPMPDSAITKIEQLDNSEDLMQSIRSRVLKIPYIHGPAAQVSLCVECDVRGFMEKQFDGSNESLGRVIVLTGTATRGQATTCSDYIYANWPLRGAWLLNMLQDAFDGAGEKTKGRNSDLQIDSMAITISSTITLDRFRGSEEATISVLQLLLWFGAAFQVSSSDKVQYSQAKLCLMFDNSASLHAYFNVDYHKFPVSEESCWLALFQNPVIAQGFPVPERSNSERGLELPIELMAELGGGRHAVDFEGGLVIKGHSIAFVPLKQYDDTIQWHVISNNDGTRLRYSDLRVRRALLKEVNFESIKTKRVILGWSEVAQTLLGTACVNYESIDWSEAQEAGRSTRLSGGGLGFQSNLVGQLNFALGAKDGRLLFSQTGPFVKIIDLAEKTPVVLYDHGERRAWLVPALEVVHHVIHTRLCLNLYTSGSSKAKFSYSDETAKISDQAARRAIMASKDQQLYECTTPGEKAYYVRDAVLDIWSLLERMMERDAMITSTPGIAVQGTWRDKLYGWEFRALVEDKNSFRRKEQVLAKTNGGWVDLVDDTDTIVLFGNGFQEVIKPVPSCSAWKVLPKGRDYLAMGCPMLETLYNEAGSRKTRSFLTSRHLQWHRGSTLFESCEEVSDCTCDRLQQLVYDSRITFGRVSPPNELPLNGCVIFGRTHHPMLPAKRTYAKQQEIRSIPSGPLPEAQLIKPEPATHSPTTSLGLRLDRDQLPDGKDSSSVLDRPASPADDESEREHRGLALKRRRELGEQDADGGDSLNARQKKSLLSRSSLLCILRTPSKTSRDKRSNLDNKGSSEVKIVTLDGKDPICQTQGGSGGDAAFDNYMHCQSRSKLNCNPEVEECVETRHASTAVNCSK